MTPVRWARRGARLLVRRWWAEARPRTGADLRGEGVAVDPEVAGRPPTPSERLRPATVATGPFAGVDPHVAPPWPTRGQAVGALAWVGLVALYARRVRAAVRAPST